MRHQFIGYVNFDCQRLLEYFYLHSLVGPSSVMQAAALFRLCATGTLGGAALGDYCT